MFVCRNQQDRGDLFHDRPIVRLFRQRLAGAGYDLGAVRAVELSLFLSMLPLHADHPDKLLGFALIAGHILDELEGGAY